MRNILLWLSSALIAVVVSCFALASAWIAFKALRLDQRLGMDEGFCLVAALVGPALIRVIHRSIARADWVPLISLLSGLTLGGFGGWHLLRARAAMATHVPSGMFSGVEHLFRWAVGFAVLSVAVLAVLGGALALVARRLKRAPPP